MRSQPVIGHISFLQGMTRGFTLPLAVRQTVITVILVMALLAFELFNFDTTRYALHNLLGGISFGRVPWATILALAFCAIDFAGLAHLCAPEREQDSSAATWYLMGAWLLGATMNALMTWWAINLTLLNHSFGNEVLSRQQILELVPPSVAVLVWLTRILFIGAFAIVADPVAGEDGLAEPLARLPGPSPLVRIPTPRAAQAATLTQTRMPITRPAVAPPQPASGRPVPRPPLPTMVGARTSPR